MSNKLIKVLGKIDEIVTEMGKFNLVPRDPTPSIDRETYSFVEKSEVIGRDAEKEMIINELLDPQRERDHISVLAIIGMGGLGKTTLAQLVYNDEKVQKTFQLLLWICVSTEFNFSNICKSIIEVATNSKENISTSTKEVLQKKLREILGKKRYLLILDDVWNEVIGKWDELRKLLFSEAGSGSVIIVTTRSHGVASIMRTLPDHDLASLNENDSLRLFEHNAFSGWAEKPQEFRIIGATIVKTISNLYNLQTLKLSSSLIAELPKEMRYMINLRHLFLDNCGRLQRMPIGLGQLKYLQTLTKYVVYSGRGGSIGELNNLNLLCGHISLSGLENVRDGKDAQSMNLAAKTNLCSLELKWDRIDNKEVTTNDQAIIEALIPHQKMKYFIINGYNGFGFPKWMMEDINVRNLKRLKLKKCINCAELPALWQLPLLENLFLERMESLRYIVSGMGKHVKGSQSLITYSVLKILEIKNLPNLENWREENSDLVDFPNLNKLVISNCGKLKSIPVCMPILASLEVCNSCEIKLRNISNLPMLLNLIAINTVDNSCSEPDAFRPPKTLETMKIHGFENVNPLEGEEEEEEEEDQLIGCQTKSLRNLNIEKSNCFFSCGPTKVVALGFWKYFEPLEYLNIFACDAIVFWPEEEFRSLKFLKELRFQSCLNFRGSLQVAVSVSSPCEHREDFLPHLKSLWIKNCRELVEIPICFKSLTDLEIWHCHKLSPEGVTLLTTLSELKRIIIVGLTNWGSWPDNMEHLPSLEQLHILGCPRIRSFPKGLQERLSSLQFLAITACPALESCCTVGGNYWHLVSRIPELHIGIEVNERQSFSKRLLNCIRGR
ncbi:Disease resistance protein RGA2 [Rhynchospora pubera]|uniref:Disease resistance protein RGA2 n=1 Tax=Rhynchospora pubera TaxID=906938 RepID=A0AAV8E487_9POAL|nr:Disease resistance protein RGA2 [Rhynchospora pubera]